jgi:hypothetical protein
VTPLERLRLATALAHTVAGAELRLTADHGDTIVVSSHPAADLDPCKLRQVVAAACLRTCDIAERIAAIAVGGSLADHQGGVFRVERDGVDQRWIASLLTPDRVAELLADIGCEQVPEESMHGVVKADPQLGVSLLVITVDDPAFASELDRIAAEAAAAVFVEELCSAAQFGRDCSER